jgi:serine protease Do
VRRAWPILVLALAGCKGSGATTSASASASAAPPPPASLAAPLPIAPGLNAPLSFAALAAKADPAVVFVKTLQEQRGRTGRRRVVGEGLGSAFVYDPAGMILTNNHVIENATDIRVIFGRDQEMQAKVVGRDPPTDIAVLRVDAKNLSHLPLGDSDSIQVGDWAVAIGNPFGLSHTVSAGIVSAKGRTGQDVKGLGDGTGYYNFLQTDASINPGNSGGPLLDLSGRVIGINTAIRARANNIGFAIPINMVKELLPHLVRDGKVKRSAIGIRVSSLVPQDLARLGLKQQNGALVRSVTPGGPGDRAGLQVDDVILGFDGQEIAGPEKLRWAASLAGVGKSATVKVQRGSRTVELKVDLGELPELPAAPGPEDPEPPDQEPDSPFGFP